MPSKPVITNLYTAVANAKRDEAVGIRVTRLTGDDGFSFFGAEVEPGRRLRAHYHAVGIEIYQIITGRGEMHLGDLQPDGEIIWGEPLTLQPGDCFTIPAGIVHQLANPSAEPLLVIFGCPAAHLGGDRTLVNDRI